MTDMRFSPLRTPLQPAQQPAVANPFLVMKPGTPYVPPVGVTWDAGAIWDSGTYWSNS